MPDRSKLKSIAKVVATYLAIAGITLVILDVVLIVLNILPPRYRYGFGQFYRRHFVW